MDNSIISFSEKRLLMVRHLNSVLLYEPYKTLKLVIVIIVDKYQTNIG